MKGLKTVFIVIIGLLCLTGCGEKKLTCTYEENDSGVKTNQKIEMKFKDDKVTAIKMSIDSKATDEEAKSSWNMVTSLLEAAYEEVDEEGLKLRTALKKTDSHANNYSKDAIICIFIL